MHLYFIRADAIKDNRPFLKLNYSFILEITYLTLIEVSTFLLSFDKFIRIRFAILILQGFIQLFVSIQQLMDFDLIINLISLLLTISLYARLTFYEFAICLIILLYLTIQINCYIIDHTISKFSQKDHKIIIILKYLLHDQKNYNFMLYKIKNLHTCTKCKTNNDMLFCLIKKQLKEKFDSKLSIMYCNEVAKYAPLKALLKLSSNGIINDSYYKIARINMMSTLQEQCTLIQDEVNRINRAINQEKSINLDSLIVFKTMSIYENVINNLKKVIKLKINYWNQLIKGHNDGRQLLESTLEMTDNILKLKSQIDDHYDLRQFKLIGYQNYDIISLKILQIYNTAIYPDGFNAIKIETITNDILRNDRFLKEDVLDNIKLLENRVIALRMSVTSIDNQFVDLNIKKLSEFLGESLEYTQSISSLNQLLPFFLQQIHSQLLNRFIQRGFSKLNLRGSGTYYQDKLEYLVPVQIYLNINYIDNNDLIINAVLIKSNTVKSILLFNEQGKILGLSSGFKEAVLKQDHYRIQDFQSGKISLFQFMPAIQNQVQSLQLQLTTQGCSELNNLKGQWNHQLPEDTSSNILIQKPQQRSTLRFDGEVKYSLNQILPNDTLAQFLKTEPFIQMQHFSTFNLKDEDLPCSKYPSQQAKQESQKFEYSINYSQLELPGRQFGYYTLTINEAKMTNNYIILESMNQLLNQQMQEDEEIQKPLVTYYKQNIETLVVPNQNETLQESNRIARCQPFIKRQDLSKKQKLSQYANFFNTRQDLRADQSTNSRGSDISTSKETLYLTQILYTNQSLNQFLLKNSILMMISILSMVAFLIFNVQFINLKLTDQKNSILAIYQPQNVNYIMTSYYYQQFQVLLDQDKVSNSSPFIKYWNEQVLIPVYKYTRPQIYALILQLAQQGEATGSQQILQVPDLINGILVNQSYSITEFYTKLNQIYEVMQRNIYAKSSQVYKFSEFTDDLYLRMSLLPMLEFQDKLIQSILESTISQQGTIAPLFISILIIELLVIFIFEVIQALYWRKLDSITVEILLLVSRINESEAIEQLQRLTETLQALQSSQNDWKSYNYFNIQFGEVYKIEEKSLILINRIKDKSYRKNSNYILIAIICIMWFAFILIGFQIHMYHNNQFQPSLTAAMKYSKFRNSFDASFILAGLIKTETLLSLKSNSYINQSNTIQWFKYFTRQLLPTINDVMNVLLTSANGGETIFDNILSGDLCTLMPNTLIMCQPHKIALETFSKDYYNDLVKSGAIGYTGSYVKFINQNYDKEFETLAYTGDTITVNTKEFQNYVLQYVLDIMECFRRFLPLFEMNNETIANGILQLVAMYYYIGGFLIITLFSVVQIMWIRRSQLQFFSLLQILTLIPLDQITNSGIRMRVKLIQKELF